jgi:iron complex transport system ATP-binding protein
MTDLLQAEHLHFAYKDRPVLTDVSLSFAPGRVYGVLGPNGCGKSTLLDLLIRRRTPQSGRIWLKGRDLVAYRRSELARQIALVPQDFYINFPYSAREVVVMGRYPHMPRFATPSPEDWALVEKVMVHTDTLQFKDRLITQLSGGERQRVIFARALAQQTPILMLDEATSNMDIRHTLALLELAAAAPDAPKRCVIAVMQDVNLAALFCDELVLMKPQTVYAQGPVAELLNREALRAVFGVASDVFRPPAAGGLQVAFYRQQGGDHAH